MKLIIEITENSYKYLKSKRNKSAAENVIANGLIYREQPTGEWIPVNPIQMDLLGGYKCSVCGSGDYSIQIGVDKYCKFCGAKMINTESEEKNMKEMRVHENGACPYNEERTCLWKLCNICKIARKTENKALEIGKRFDSLHDNLTMKRKGGEQE